MTTAALALQSDTAAPMPEAMPAPVEPAPAPAGNAVQAAPPIILPTAASGNATP